MVVKKKKVRSNSFSRKRILFSTVLIVLLIYSIVLLLVSVFAINSPYRVENVPYDFSVKTNLGVNVDSDVLHFGGGPAGTILSRGLFLTSDVNSKVVISWEGPGVLSIDKNNFLIEKGKNETVNFYLLVPSNLSLGTYYGNVTFNFFES